MDESLSINNIDRLFNYMRARHADFYQKISEEYVFELADGDIDKLRLASKDQLLTPAAEVISTLEYIVEQFKAQEIQARGQRAI